MLRQPASFEGAGFMSGIGLLVCLSLAAGDWKPRAFQVSGETLMLHARSLSVPKHYHWHKVLEHSSLRLPWFLTVVISSSGGASQVFNEWVHWPLVDLHFQELRRWSRLIVDFSCQMKCQWALLQEQNRLVLRMDNITWCSGAAIGVWSSSLKPTTMNVWCSIEGTSTWNKALMLTIMKPN